MEALAVSINEAAKALSLSRSTIYLLIAENRLETRKIGRRTVIPATSLVKLLEV